jgi:hypothetical protein
MQWPFCLQGTRTCITAVTGVRQWCPSYAWRIPRLTRNLRSSCRFWGWDSHGLAGSLHIWTPSRRTCIPMHVSLNLYYSNSSRDFTWDCTGLSTAELCRPLYGKESCNKRRPYDTYYYHVPLYAGHSVYRDSKRVKLQLITYNDDFSWHPLEHHTRQEYTAVLSSYQNVVAVRTSEHEMILSAGSWNGDNK